METRIEYINHSIAYTVEKDGEKYIQINKKLLDYPKLMQEVIVHEQGHIERDGLIANLWHDLIDTKPLFNLDLWKFCLKEPSTFVTLIPIYKEKGEIVYNMSCIFNWMLIVLALLFAVVWNTIY